MRPWIARGICHAWVGAALLASRLLPSARRRAPPPGEAPRRLTLALLGPFPSANWLEGKTGPLARSTGTPRIVAFSSRPLAMRSAVELQIAPPRWTACLGAGIARALWFTRWCWHHRPDVVIGFHLPWNGLVALLVARLVGARAVYFCVGGVHELLEGGVHSEHRVFAAMNSPSPALQRRLVRLVNRFDDVLTTGTRSRAALLAAGVRRPVHPLGAGIDDTRFRPAADDAPKDVDIITVARLAPVKRLDVLITAVSMLATAARARGQPAPRALVVGDGPQRQALGSLAQRLGVDDLVHFLGTTDDVAAQLRRARVFVLTSKSEGLPTSLLEALCCGVPGVVPLVGDVEDVLQDGGNGHVVDRGSALAYAEAIGRLLGLPPSDYRALAQAALRSAARYTIAHKATEWSRLVDAWSAG